MLYKKQKKILTIAICLLFTLSTATVLLPEASAADKKATYAYVGAMPNPVGIGQETLIHLGITDAISGAANGWTGLTVKVTKPDGTTQTLGPFKTDSTGGTGTVYVPDAAGNYTLQTIFPEQVSPVSGRGFAANTTLLASQSPPLTLVVEDTPLVYYPAFALPTEYWTRPIDSQIREWYSIAGSWLTIPANFYAPYNDGPDTAHILWTKPITIGGEVGGDMGIIGSGATSVGFETGDAYEGKWSNSFIVAGLLYYQDAPMSASGRGSPVLYHCVDLHTGEELWQKTFLDNRSISFAQLYYWQSYNYMGTYAYLWVTVGSTWTAFDAYTGDIRAIITDVPGTSRIIGSNGEIYVYSLSTQNSRLTIWNMSALISLEGSFGSAFMGRQYNASSGTYRSMTSDGSWGTETTTGAAARAARAYVYNGSIPTGLTGSVRAVNFNDKLVGMSIQTTAVRTWGISIKEGSIGTLLFDKTWTPPSDWSAGNQTIAWMTGSFEDNVGVLFSTETMQHYGFSLTTGDYLWGPTTPAQHYLDSLDDSKSACRAIAYGKLYSASVGGIVYCYDVKTGQLLWNYEASDPYTEILWSNNWWLRPMFICEGKIYVGSLEHSANQPLPRGSPFICLNATDGEELWRVNGLFRQTRWGGRAIIGDSIIATMDTYDQRVYAVGKGPSALTVSAPDSGVLVGNSIVIKGSVNDISPGTKDTAITMRFPNGVPAVSDACQSDWMLYVYKQFQHPTNATGVPVSIDVVDSNGNYRNLGTATTDSSGTFSLAWQPDIPGTYTVIATFAGSAAYYPSYAQTSFVADQGVEITPAPTQTPTVSVADQYFMPAVIAIVLAIVIGFIATILILRKRP